MLNNLCNCLQGQTVRYPLTPGDRENMSPSMSHICFPLIHIESQQLLHHSLKVELCCWCTNCCSPSRCFLQQMMQNAHWHHELWVWYRFDMFVKFQPEGNSDTLNDSHWIRPLNSGTLTLPVGAWITFYYLSSLCLCLGNLKSNKYVGKAGQGASDMCLPNVCTVVRSRFFRLRLRI